jgi:hypothetical protein
MAWIGTQPRLTQVYTFVVAALNDCGIEPDHAVIKPWIREELPLIDPPPSKLECDTVLYGMYQEKVKFFGRPDSLKLFEKHELFKGSTLGRK